jgi:hypothetical protein
MMFPAECCKGRLAEKAFLDSIVFHPKLLAENLFSHPIQLSIHLIRSTFMAPCRAWYA